MRNVEMGYYNIYYYCNILDNLLHYFTEHIDWITTGAQFSGPYFEAEVPNFAKYSALHEFCFFAVKVLVNEDAEDSLKVVQERYDELKNENNKTKRLRKAFQFDEDHRDGKIEIDRILFAYKPEAQSFFSFLLNSDCKCISNDYLDFVFLNGDLEDVLTQMSRELFYVLFQNRDFLFRFNTYMANANPSRIKRCSIPIWVKRAVRFRDRGRCVCCGADLSGHFDCEDEGAVHYDHIVSLHEGGLNDVSNIQLLCQKCNLSKSGESYTSTVYKDWYDFKM